MTGADAHPEQPEAPAVARTPLTELSGLAHPTPVTEPDMPPLEEFVPYLEQIWENRWLTNGGQFHQELEQRLADRLGVEHVSLFCSGTIALIVALQCLRVTGEVITTPYSFVATAHSLLWNGIKPVFVDIDPATFNIDPDAIEPAITGHTTAIMPVHCYGNPCDVDRIQEIADRYGLRVIYDAAHVFDVTFRGRPLLDNGDMSVLSFHATKVFTTFEGGAIVTPDAKIKRRIDHLKNFGFVDETTVAAAGINGKMNEVQAAFGLLQLDHVDESIRRRAEIDAHYRAHLSDVPGVVVPHPPVDATRNHPYFPILVSEEYPGGRDGLFQRLRSAGIFARRYFYPLISDFPMYRGLESSSAAHLPVATRIASQVLCLPIYPALTRDDADRVIAMIRQR